MLFLESVCKMYNGTPPARPAASRGPSPSPPPTHRPTRVHARRTSTRLRARTDSLTTLVRICTPKPTTAIAAGVSEAELRALTDKLEGSLEVQLGIIIEKRKIRLGEVVGTWCRSRGQDAQSPRDGRSPRTAGYSMGRRSPRRRLPSRLDGLKLCLCLCL